MERWWVEVPEGPPPKYPYEPPDIRRRIIVEDYDYGRMVRHEFVLLKSGRIDCYRVAVDGKLLPGRIGWSKILELVRKAFVRATTRVFD
jgi:hypothetical protein